jgi:hypothetical protein
MRRDSQLIKLHFSDRSVINLTKRGDILIPKITIPKWILWKIYFIHIAIKQINLEKSILTNCLFRSFNKSIWWPTYRIDIVLIKQSYSESWTRSIFVFKNVDFLLLLTFI